MRNSFTRFIEIFLLLAGFLYSNLALGTTYFSRTSGGNWNVATTWSTLTYGSATNTGTYPKAGDIVNIGNGYTVYISASAACATLNIGQGVSGILEYKNGAGYNLAVTGNILINNGGKFWYNSATALTHTLNCGGSITNLGVLDFYFSATAVVNITFDQSTNGIMSGSGVWDLNNVTLFKSGSTAAYIDVQTNSFETAIKSLTTTYGTYIHDNAGTYNINAAAASNYTIGPNVIFKVPLGTLGFATAATSLTLQGQLLINGGTCNVGSAAGTQGIFSDQSGASVAFLIVSSGTLNVHGGITYAAASGAKPFGFSMTGGNIVLNSGTTGSSRQVFCVNDVVNSVFNMSGGTITLQMPNTTGATIADVAICGNNGTVTSTGGTIQFGNASTTAGKIFNFVPYANAVYPNFKITGNAGTAFSMATSTGSTANFKLLSLYIDVAKTFDVRSISGTAGDNKMITLTSTWNGSEAFTNNGTFTPRTGTVQFNPTGAQSIGGTVTTTFFNLTINNSNGITLNKSENVSNLLSMVVGVLYSTTAKILTLNSGASSNIGSAVAYVDGPMVSTIASISTISLTYPLGKAGFYRPVVLTVKHSTTASVTYKAEVFNFSAMALPYTLPASIAKVSSMRYVQFARQNVANFSNGKIQMYYGSDDGVTDYTSLLVAHDNGVSQWQNFGGIATANNAGSITSNTFAGAFHTYFALGNPPGGNNALPISLLSFNAFRQDNHVNVEWKTAMEINNHFFTVEHSKDNINFTPFATVNGAGNSNEVLSYSATDNSELNENNYYRLKQTDFNGDFTYSKIVLVRVEKSGSVSVFPNPVSQSTVHLSFQTTGNSAVNVQIINILGDIIAQALYPSNAFGTYDINVDLNKITRNGIYILRITSGDEVQTQRLLVTGR